jgi:hypothetical protein
MIERLLRSKPLSSATGFAKPGPDNPPEKDPPPEEPKREEPPDPRPPEREPDHQKDPERLFNRYPSATKESRIRPAGEVS